MYNHLIMYFNGNKGIDYVSQGKEFDPRCLLAPCRFTTDYSMILSGIIVVVAGVAYVVGLIVTSPITRVVAHIKYQESKRPNTGH